MRFDIHPPPPKTSLVRIELSEAPCSPNLSMINDSLLRGIQYPPHAVFQQFLSTARLPPPNIQSVAIGTLHLPLAVLRIWSVWLQVGLIQTAWLKAIRWLELKGNSTQEDNDVYSFIDTVKWSAALEGVRIQCGVSALSRLLLPEWLAGDDIDILVEGLRRKSASSSVSICFLT